MGVSSIYVYNLIIIDICICMHIYTRIIERIDNKHVHVSRLQIKPRARYDTLTLIHTHARTHVAEVSGTFQQLVNLADQQKLCNNKHKALVTVLQYQHNAHIHTQHVRTHAHTHLVVGFGPRTVNT